MTVTRITKADYIDRQPEIEDIAEQLRASSDPKLVARVQREYWWEESRGGWYSCVQNYENGDWETTDVGCSSDGFWGALHDAVAPDRPQTLQLVPLTETPAIDEGSR